MGCFRQEYWSDYHFLLLGSFPTEGSIPHLLCLLHCRWNLYLLSHWGSQVFLHMFLKILWTFLSVHFSCIVYILVIAQPSRCLGELQSSTRRWRCFWKNTILKNFFYICKSMLQKKVISQFMLNTVDCLLSFHSLPIFPLQKAPTLFTCL